MLGVLVVPHALCPYATLSRLHLLLKTAPGFKVFSDDRIKLLLLHLQSMTESLLPVMLMELLLLLSISVLLMPKLPLVSFHSMRIQAAAAVVAAAASAWAVAAAVRRTRLAGSAAVRRWVSAPD